MTEFFSQIELPLLMMAFAITVIAGFVKGAVGFAMPLIMISGMSAFMDPKLALAALIVPTVLANVWQALRGGVAQMISLAAKYKVYLGIVLLFIMLSAQLVKVMPTSVLFLILGISITAVTGYLLSGAKLTLNPETKYRSEILIGTFAGFLGGISGVWGPPTVAYLTAVNTPKKEQVQIQGVIYGLGAVVLMLAHLKSGVLNMQTLPLSLAMIVPALIGMGLGFWVQDRLDQRRFRRVTLIILALAGLNLIRKGLMG